MEIIKHVLNKPKRYGSSESDHLSDFDFNSIPSFVQEIWYWYSDGGYDGSGQMLLRSGDTYALSSISHCSCYGPCEDSSSIAENQYCPLEELGVNCTKDYLDEVQMLLDAAKV